MTDPANLHRRVAASISSVVRGQDAAIRKPLAAFVAGGHGARPAGGASAPSVA